MTPDYKCEVCGIEVTSGLMAAMCPYREHCEFWPEDLESQQFLDSLGMRYKPEQDAARTGGGK